MAGEGKPRRDWIAIVISIFALLTSAGTAYLTLLRKTDDIRVTINEQPLLNWAEGFKRLKIQGGHSMVFINSGNRPAAITGQEYFIVPARMKCEDRGKKADWVITLGSDFQPFALKENEVAVRTAKVAGAMTGYLYQQERKSDAWYGNPLFLEQATNKGENTIPAPQELISGANIEVRLCYRFTLSTPTNAQISKIVETFDYPIYRNASLTSYEPDAAKPVLLYSNYEHIFVEKQ